MGVELLLLSNSRAPGMEYLQHAKSELLEFLGDQRTLYFAPYAIADHDGYTAQIQAAFQQFGVSVIGLHTVENPKEAIEKAEILFVGGGNSFRLLKTLQTLDLIEVVQRRVKLGSLRYMGSSAGTNMACPTLRTTNDMPIVQPASFESFNLVPFQINPHYLDAPLNATHQGETRAQRIEEFLEENDVPVIGLPEGTWLREHDEQLLLGGLFEAVLFERGATPRFLKPGTDLTWLLANTPRFDQRG